MFKKTLCLKKRNVHNKFKSMLAIYNLVKEKEGKIMETKELRNDFNIRKTSKLFFQLINIIMTLLNP